MTVAHRDQVRGSAAGARRFRRWASYLPILMVGDTETEPVTEPLTLGRFEPGQSQTLPVDRGRARPAGSPPGARSQA